MRQWSYPDNCVVFSQFGAVGWLFQYEDASPEAEPRIIHAYSDCADGPILTLICDRFSELIAALRSDTTTD